MVPATCRIIVLAMILVCLEETSLNKGSIVTIMTVFLFALGLLSYQNFIEIMMETMQAMTHWGKLKTVLEGYVGFDTVQEQIRKKSLKRGFEFNLMVVGKFCLYHLWFDFWYLWFYFSSREFSSSVTTINEYKMFYQVKSVYNTFSISLVHEKKFLSSFLTWHI